MGLENILKKTYVITTAQGESRLNHRFYESLVGYCERNKAELVVLPIQGSCKDEQDMHPRLQEHVNQAKHTRLNKNFSISDFGVKPQQIDPVTGVARFAQDSGSTAFAGTKQRLKIIPNSNHDLPKAIMTTGAVTLPNYSDTRIGRIATNDHTYGALIVELEGSFYHYRHVSALKNGTFNDLGVRYDGITARKERPEALVLGDWHTGQTNKKVKDDAARMMQEYKPKRVFIHDFFDGYSISHHEEGRTITKALKAHGLGVSLEDELKKLAKEFNWFVQNSPKDTELVFVRSNHDEVLHRYLEEARFVGEPQNTLLGAHLMVDYIEGRDPLVEGLKHHTHIPDRATFLTRDDDYKVRGWQLGNHGDLGANGARGSNRSIEYANGKSITGHRHTPEIFRNVYVVGTSTNLKLDYTKGFSSWMNTHAMVYRDGKAQLINVIKGKHRRDLK
jgi:hypothetical protein